MEARKLTFERAEKQDIPAIFAQARTLADTYEDVSTIDYSRVMAWMERKITLKIEEYTRVALKGEICAYFRLTEEGELDDLYVLDPFRGRGVGSAILARCIRESKSPLWLYVFTENRRAIALYRRFGFAPAEAVGKTRLIMKREEQP